MTECFNCDCYDEDFGCTMPSVDQIYACPLYADEIMYKTPINLITSNINTQVEDNILTAIQQIGVDIDKDELIKALKYDRNQYEKGYQRALKDSNKWIPCSEKLPELYEWVIGTIDYGNKQMIACIRREGNDRWSDISNWSYGYGMITTWMPLPEPYQKDED